MNRDGWIDIIKDGEPEKHGFYLAAWSDSKYPDNKKCWMEILEFFPNDDPEEPGEWERIPQAIGTATVHAWQPLPDPFIKS